MPTSSESPGRPRAHLVTVSDDQAGQRIDNFLMARLKDVPRARVYRSIRGGEVRVNGGRIRQTYRVARGDEVRVPPIGGPARGPVDVPDAAVTRLRERVLHDDPWLIVVDKPAGLAVHGGSGLRLGLIETLRADPQVRGDVELVHRLDRDTSGCLLVARRRSALRALHEALREQRVTKHYLALVHGRVRRVIEANAALAPSLGGGERRMRTRADGKAASTRLEPLGHGRSGAGESFTLVRALPRTGRTHQIRVHAAAAGHPLAADDKYAPREALRSAAALGLTRLFLHAERLEFEHPSGSGRVSVEAPLPDGLAKVLDRLGVRLPAPSR